MEIVFSPECFSGCPSCFTSLVSSSLPFPRNEFLQTLPTRQALFFMAGVCFCL